MNIDIYLQPKQSQFNDAIERYPVTFYGGARGGGKSKGLQLIMLLRRIKYPGSTGAIFRRTFPELEGNHIRPLFAAYPQLRQYYREANHVLTLPNGSTLQFCHCQNEDDVDLYQGREFHDLAIDEAGQWPEVMVRRLQGSNRSARSDIPARLILTGNPGGLGHGWLKRLFIERRFNPRERPGDYVFIKALVDDNTALIQADPDYVARLDAEPNEAIRRAYRYGDWDIFAGQFFGEIAREVHFIPPFAIPAHWNRFGAYDYGFNHPAAFGWFANDEDGNTYLYRELLKAKYRVDQFAELINTHADSSTLYPIVGGADCWTVKSTLRDDKRPPTVAEEFSSHGIALQRAVIDRVQGAAHLRSYLAWQGKPGNKPRFYIFKTCPVSFDCLTRMVHDPDRVEDVLKVDATEGDPLSGDDCFARGTLIATSNGQKPIEQIQCGDLIWTRKGLRPVIDAWLNAINRETVKVIFSNGQSLTGTSNHILWIEDQWRYLDAVRYGNTALCLNQKLLNSMALNLDVIPNLSEDICETITGLLENSTNRVLELCMSKFGKKLMVKYPRDSTFITPMGIHSTTHWKIWSRLMLQLICKSISKTQKDFKKLESIFYELDHLLVPGIKASLVENGTVSLQYNPMLNDKGSHHVVSCVMLNFIQKTLKKLNSVVEHVSKRTIDDKQQVKLLLNARRVAKISQQVNISRPELAVINVEAILDSQKHDTYCLHVADTHEYFANGILVHNCYDMIRYGLMSRPAITDPIKPKIVIGSHEWHAEQNRMLFEKELEKMQREQEETFRRLA